MAGNEGAHIWLAMHGMVRATAKDEQGIYNAVSMSANCGGCDNPQCSQYDEGIKNSQDDEDDPLQLRTVKKAGWWW
jgi:hypothetical protein